jgi:hypothetical protein
MGRLDRYLFDFVLLVGNLFALILLVEMLIAHRPETLSPIFFPTFGLLVKIFPTPYSLT